MSRLSCLLLVLTLMACSAASTKKEIKEEKIIASAGESMTRGSLFGIGSLVQQKIQNKKKLISSIIAKKKSIKSRSSLFGIGSLIKHKIQNKKKLISSIIAKKKSIINKRSVVDSVASPKEASLFGIGSLNQQKIHNKEKLISSIIGKKKSLKSRGSLFGIQSKLYISKLVFFLNKSKDMDIQSLIKHKIQKFVSDIIAKKKSIKSRRSVLDSSASFKEHIDEEKMLANVDTSKTRGSLFGIGSFIQKKIQNKKKLISSIIAKKKGIKHKILR